MIDHDPLCPLTGYVPYIQKASVEFCRCDFIKKVRSDERNKIIQDEIFRLVKVSVAIALANERKRLTEGVDQLERVTTHMGTKPSDVLYTVWLDEVLSLLGGSSE